MKLEFDPPRISEIVLEYAKEHILNKQNQEPVSITWTQGGLVIESAPIVTSPQEPV